jgi:hypothetical protein
VEQLTGLLFLILFLKMADEQSRPPFNKPSPIPKGKDWPALLVKDADRVKVRASGQGPNNSPIASWDGASASWPW